MEAKFYFRHADGQEFLDIMIRDDLGWRLVIYPMWNYLWYSCYDNPSRYLRPFFD